MIATHRCPQCDAELAADAPEGLCPECLLGQAVGPTGEWQSGAMDSPYPAGFIPPRPGELAPHFPQLEILELLGQGGMGAVYKARQTKLDRLVALKILPPAWGKDPAFAERFSREARALAQLSHPSTIAVHDFGETAGLYYFIMEYVDGANLRQLLQAGPIGPREAVDIAAQVCDALQYAHEQGIIHRDIKPENILLDQRGRVKIADFGLAKLLGTVRPVFTLTGSRQVVGTPHYMAPEQMEKPQTVDHRADLYSLGVVFYEMLTGELPLGRFSAPSQKVALDPRLDHIVLRALEKDPERRYQRARELKADLVALAGTGPLPGARSSPVRAYQEEVNREMSRWQVAGPAAGLILTGVVAFLYWLGMGIAGLGSFIYEASRHRVYADDIFLVITLGVIGVPLVLLATGFLVTAGRRMARFDSYVFVLLACLWAMMPWSAAFLIGFPIGLWALWVLRKQEVRLAFASRAVQDRLGLAAGLPVVIPVTPPRRGPIRRAVGSLYRNVLSLVVGSQVREVPPTGAGHAAAAPASPWAGAAARSPGGLWPGAEHASPGGLEAGIPLAPAPRKRRWWPLVIALGIPAVLLMVFMVALLSYAIRRADRMDYYAPTSASWNGGAGGSTPKMAATDNLAPWYYPGAQRYGAGESPRSRHVRLTTTDSLEKVADWYERETGARFMFSGPGGHGSGTIGDIYYDYQDDSLEPPAGKDAKVARPVALRLLVVQKGQVDYIVVLSRARGEDRTYIALTRMDKH